MKKTIISLFVLPVASISYGQDTITLDDGAAFTSTTYVMDTTSPSWNASGASVTLLLDVDSFSSLFKNATSSARPVFVSMSGSGSNIVGLEAHEANRICGAGGVVAGNTYNNQYSFTNDSIASVDWDKAKAAALTMALETTSLGTTWTLSVLNDDNTYTELTASNTGLRWGNMNDITTIAIDQNVVIKAYAFDGHITGDTAKSLNHSAVAASIPEPTTATLSLLALAALAARRRRR